MINSGIPWDGGNGAFEKMLLHASWAVNGFLILSGFVIAKLIREKGEGYWPYLTRRFFRLYPVYVLTLIPSLFFVGHDPIGWVVSSIAAHLTLLHGIVPEAIAGGPIRNECFAGSILPPAWSISLEWQFYVVAPFLVTFLFRLRLRWWLLIAFLFYLPVCRKWGWILDRQWPLGSFLPLKLLYFYCGVVLYRLWPNGYSGLRLPRWTLGLQWLGKVSYSTYLVHWPVLVLLAWGLTPLLADKSTSYKSWVLFACGAPIIIGLSALLYYAIEKPGIGWGRAVIRTRREQHAKTMAWANR